eukprot:325706-Prymnesium_polylepis.1
MCRRRWSRRRCCQTSRRRQAQTHAAFDMCLQRARCRWGSRRQWAFDLRVPPLADRPLLARVSLAQGVADARRTWSRMRRWTKT